MKGNKSRFPTIALVIAIFAALVALILAVLLAGEAIHLTDPATLNGATRVSISILLLGGVVMVVLFAAFLVIGIDDWRADVPISPLYWPQVCVKGTMCAYMMTISPSALDLLLHGLHPRWTILYTPVARIFQSVLLFAVFVSFAGVLATILRGRAQERERGRIAAAVANVLGDLREQVRTMRHRQRAIERRADTAETRADVVDTQQIAQDDRISTTEEVLEIKHTVTKKTDGAE